MPVKDGNAAIREIIDFDKNADIIIVSSVGTQSQLRAAIEAGAKDFVQKPLKTADQIQHIITSRFERGANYVRPVFGNYLLANHVVTGDQLIHALEKKSSEHLKLGTHLQCMPDT